MADHEETALGIRLVLVVLQGEPEIRFVCGPRPRDRAPTGREAEARIVDREHSLSAAGVVVAGYDHGDIIGVDGDAGEVATERLCRVAGASGGPCAGERADRRPRAHRLQRDTHACIVNVSW